MPPVPPRSETGLPSERRTHLPGRVVRIVLENGESAEDGWRSSGGCPERGGGAAVGREEEGAAGISHADAVEPRCPAGSFSCRGDDTGRAVGRRFEMAENVVVRQGQERGRQDVRREQHSREHAAPGRAHHTFQYTGNWFRGSGVQAVQAGSTVQGSGFRVQVGARRRATEPRTMNLEPRTVNPEP